MNENIVADVLLTYICERGKNYVCLCILLEIINTHPHITQTCEYQFPKQWFLFAEIISPVIRLLFCSGLREFGKDFFFWLLLLLFFIATVRRKNPRMAFPSQTYDELQKYGFCFGAQRASVKTVNRLIWNKSACFSSRFLLCAPKELIGRGWIRNFLSKTLFIFCLKHVCVCACGVCSRVDEVFPS